MRLGFHYHIPAAAEPDGVLAMAGYQARFVEGLAEHVEELVCFLHSDPRDESPVRVDAGNVRWIDLGRKRSLARRLAYPALPGPTIREAAQDLDAMLIRAPTPLALRLARIADIPTALLVVGDYVASARTLQGPPMKRALVKGFARWNARSLHRVARRALVMTNSEALQGGLLADFGEVPLVRTTTLRRSDLVGPKDQSSEPPYRLLFIGRLDMSKGLAELLAATAELVSRGHDVLLDIVGASPRGDVEQRLQSQIDTLGLSGRVRLHGFKPIGPQLFSHYEEADLFITPSTGNEGFPRTIWEALAHAVPVVATDVGGVRSAVEGAACIVEPGDPIALADAVAGLIMDAGARDALVQAGCERVAQVTVEEQGRVLVGHVERWLRERVNEQ